LWQPDGHPSQLLLSFCFTGWMPFMPPNQQRQSTENLKYFKTRMWAIAQSDGRPAEYGWRPLFIAAKFG